MIEIKSVTKKYEDFTAIENISFTVDNCSVTGLCGFNGAGKTTLLRVCAGIFRPESGEVTIDGENVFDNASNRTRLFFLPDEMLLGGSTVKACAKYYGDYYPDFDKKIFDNVCEIFGINQKSRTRSLSKGMKKQLSLALAFAAKPKYLLIDETFDGLDPHKKTLLREIMLEYIAETDASVLISSHSLQELAGVCDRIVLINGKNVQLCCDIGDISKNYRRVLLDFEKPVNEIMFKDVNYRRIRLSGRRVSLVICGDIDSEIEKIKALGAEKEEITELSLEEVFAEETQQDGKAAGVKTLFDGVKM